MALIKCPECGKEISDKAKSCPHCGYELERNKQRDEIKSNDNIEEYIKSKESLEKLNDESEKIKKKRRIIIVSVLLVFFLVIIVLGVKQVIKKVPINRKETNTNIVVEKKEINDTKSTNIEMSWADGMAPTEVGNGDSIAKLLDTEIVNSSYGMLLVMSFEYTNNSENEKNLINDVNCLVTPYQDGVALGRPGMTSEEGKYDSNDSYTLVKKGGTITSQLVWVLKDTVTPIEIEFGQNEEYNPDYLKIITLNGGTKAKDVSDTEKEIAKSDYAITWSDKIPETIGDENEQAIIKNVAIVESANYGTVLVIDIDFINNLDEARNLINNIKCRIEAYQNGVELESPGVTSDKGYFDYTDAFTSVKKGGKVSTQLVWSLRDDSPVEVGFGLDENYQTKYIATLSFEKE